MNFCKLQKVINIYSNSKLCLSTSSVVNKTLQMGKTMKKVLHSNVKKRKSKYIETISVTPDNTFSKPPTTNPKRITVLNKLFMRNITDLMSSENYSSLLAGVGLEINKVKIAPDFKIVNVYWIANEAEQDKVEEILQKNAGLLRHELSQLRLMGSVPRIHFVKDKQYGQLVELNKRLAIADYGEEVPNFTDSVSQFITEPILSIPVEENLKSQIEKLEEEDLYNSDEENELPPMFQSIFNLHHNEILNRIKQSNKKINLDIGNDENNNWAEFKLKQYSNTEPVVLGNAKMQREAFNKFLKQRQLLKQKLKQNKFDDDHSLLEEEEEYNIINNNFNNDNDYILEDIDESDK